MKDKAILFLSHLIPKEYDEESELYSKRNMQDAANVLQWHLINGLSYHLHKNMDVINLMLIGSYPQYYKKAFIQESLFDCQTQNMGINIGFCNLKYIRRRSIEKNLYVRVKQWCEQNKQLPRTIIIYSLHPIALKVLSKIKASDSSICICAIVADLPNMTNLSSKTDIIHRIAQFKFSSDAFSYVASVDKFVFLTQYMSDYLHNDKPYCIMEGIATNLFKNIDSNVPTETDVKTILYTGTLHKKFGVLHLLEAFSKISCEKYRLVICGAGDSEKEIRAAAAKDSRIVYKGQCSRKDVLKLQKDATVLVNPRMNIEEFTKYSFPSKNMEYMSSGTPVVAYKLDGIPDEYNDYIIFVKDNKVETLAETLINICETSFEERQKIGEKAKRFVMECKNEIVQTECILKLLDDSL